MHLSRSETGDRVAVLFPGIEVSLCGAEQSRAAAHPELFASFFERAAAAAGVAASAGHFLGAARIDDTLERHVEAYAFSCALFESIRDRLTAPVCYAGHSMGLYGALWAAGAVSFDDGARLARGAWRSLEGACPPGRAAMTVVVGLHEDECRAIARANELTSVTLVAKNSDTCFALAGAPGEIERFETLAAGRDAFRVQRLSARFPYHHPTLHGARKRFERHIARCSWREPHTPVVGGIRGDCIHDSGGLRLLAAENIDSLLDWRAVMHTLAAAGVDYCIECGAGTSLSRHAKFTRVAPRCISLRAFERALS
jgi:[acyl-carrier-protein] S-malonyltransferase